MRTRQYVGWFGAAGALLAAIACAPVVPVATSPTPTAGATTPPLPAPTPLPSASAGATTAAGVSPGADANTGAGATASTIAATLTGTLYDIDGQPIDGASVRVHGLLAGAAYDMTSLSTAGGHFTLTAIPPGVNLEVIASKANWTTRRRVLSLVSGPNVANFGTFVGGPSGTCSPGPACDEAAYFLSDRPEVTLVDPIQDGVLADPTRFHVVLALSSALDADNRARFADALRIVPANLDAQGGVQGYTDLADEEDRAFPADRDLRGVGTYQVHVGSIMRQDSASAATLNWNAEGTQATFDFPAAPLHGRTGVARYQLALGAGTAPIVDRAGHLLGTDATGSFNRYPAVGHLVHSVFQAGGLHLASLNGLVPGSREERWAATHDNTGRCRIDPTRTPPHLTGVTATNVNGDTVLALSFDEPLVAYDGSSTGRLGVGLDPLLPPLHLTFAVAQHFNDLASLLPTGKNMADLDPRVTTKFGALEAERRREFEFLPGAVVSTFQGAPDGSVGVSVDPADAHRALFTLFRRPNFFDAALVEIKARVEGIGDPAANLATAADADANIFTGPF
jgi:hypothetical protein